MANSNASAVDNLNTRVDVGGQHSMISNEQSPENTVPQTPIIQGNEQMEQHEVMAFVDETPKASVEFAGIEDPTFSHDMLPSQELKDYLARPVDIFTYEWIQGNFDYVFIQPWFLFLNSDPIKRKIDNFAFLQGQLHVKVLVNASPFYQGALLAAYQPLTSFSKDIAANASNTLKADILFSQRPHIYILPQTNQGGEMTLPFFYHKNWLNITSTNDVRAMGRLDVRPLVPLSNANGVTGEVLKIKFYAWMTDVKLCGPTISMSLQAKRPKHVAENIDNNKDEYGKGPVSSIASAVADAANYLTKVPYIGKFAKATSIGADSVSRIASLFGFTNVPVISDVMPLKNLPFHSLASASIGEPVSKLSLDPKNELTIDPRTTGLGEGDELSIPYLVQRESLLTTILWTSTRNVDDLLFYSRVCPNMADSSTLNVFSLDSVLYLTPMAMVNQMFTYWRGDIIFRIKCICTKYHKGRVRITWDPISNVGLSQNVSNETTSFNRIVDISPDLDMEVRCSYLQSRHFLRTRKVPGNIKNFSTSDTAASANSTGLDPDFDFDNGALSIRVVNDLSSPVASSDVSFLVYVRGADNLEFTDPYSDFDLRLSHFEPQSGGVLWHDVDDDTALQTGAPITMPDNQYLVYSGEAIGSLRTLLRRSYDDAPVVTLESGIGDVGSPNTFGVVTTYQAHLPLTPGYDPDGPHRAIDTATTGAANYSYVKFSPLTWILPSFVGYRGSMIYHYNMDTTSKSRQAMSFQFERSELPVVQNSNLGLAQIFTNAFQPANFSDRPRFVAENSQNGSGGVALTNTLTQSGCSVLVPFYSPFRFASADNVGYAQGSSVDETDQKSIRGRIYIKPDQDNMNMTAVTIVKKYSIGTDFNAFFFLNVPEIYFYRTYPGTSS